MLISSRDSHGKTGIGATLYQFGVDTDSSKPLDREAKPEKAEPKRDQPSKDERPVDDKTPVVRHG